MKIILLIFVVNTVSFGHSLVKINAVVNNDIIETELKIKENIKKIFNTLKLVIRNKGSTENKTAGKTLDSNETSYNEKDDLIPIINEILQQNDTEIKLPEDILNYKVIPKKIYKTRTKDEVYNIKEIESLLDNYQQFFLSSKNPDNNTVLDSEDSSSISLQENNTNVDTEFWVPDLRRIYKGLRANIKDFPFMASVHVMGRFQCAGSIIKSDLIITAASCLQLAYNNRFYRENPNFLSVRVGSTFFHLKGETVPVLEVYFHPEYDPKTLAANLAVMRLERRLNLERSRRVKKIDIDRASHKLSYRTPGITIVGWGPKTKSNRIPNPGSQIMSYAGLDYYDLRECQDIYNDDLNKYVTKKNFCAGFLSKGEGACNHDVGGPGISQDRLMGVISFGSQFCGRPDSPTVFVKLGFYSDWIDEIIRQRVPHQKKRTTTSTTIHLKEMAEKLWKTTRPYRLVPIKTALTTHNDVNVQRNIYINNADPESLEIERQTTTKNKKKKRKGTTMKTTVKQTTTKPTKKSKVKKGADAALINDVNPLNDQYIENSSDSDKDEEIGDNEINEDTAEESILSQEITLEPETDIHSNSTEYNEGPQTDIHSNSTEYNEGPETDIHSNSTEYNEGPDMIDSEMDGPDSFQDSNMMEGDYNLGFDYLQGPSNKINPKKIPPKRIRKVPKKGSETSKSVENDRQTEKLLDKTYRMDRNETDDEIIFKKLSEQLLVDILEELTNKTLGL